ncbi:MAG: outer-membrane lipoprotein carrier protein LolA, partial [Rhizobiaceae bacterium]|nr:outer-membrane lipoprotein carrier protein LolA [Rhizobiaceae bacterium]
DPKTFDLRQWTITDAQAKDTTVMIFNVKTGTVFDPSVFEIPYSDVHSQKR